MKFAIASDGEKISYADEARVWYIYDENLISVTSVKNASPEEVATILKKLEVSRVFALGFPYEYRTAFLRKSITLHLVLASFSIEEFIQMIKKAMGG